MTFQNKYKVDKAQVLNSAKGRWLDVFNYLGLNVQFNRHQFCPACGGNDRFRFDDKYGNGDYYCNHCGAADGLSLITKALGITFKDALYQVNECLNGSSEPLPHIPYEAPAESKKCNKAKVRAAVKIFQIERQNWVPAKDNHPYLIKKQIPALGVYQHKTTGALIVPYCHPFNGYTTFQYINKDGTKPFVKDGINAGAFFQIGKPKNNKVIISTGYSTSASLHLATGLMVWSAPTDNTLIHVVEHALNEGLTVCLAADNDHEPKDKSPITEHKNSGLIHAQKIINEYPQVTALMPDPESGISDFNDVHCAFGLMRLTEDFHEFLIGDQHG